MMPPDDYDSPWKEALECYLPDIVAFFFPQIAAEIDWSRGYEFLDKELQQVVREAESGRRAVDKLVQVWRRDGRDAWVLIHIEVQSQEESGFPLRMYVYHYRLFDRYQRPVVSLAVLGDEQEGWRPTVYATEMWGCGVTFRFPMVKLREYRARWAELENSRNPCATVVMAHLGTQETRGDMAGRGRIKLALTRRLYDQGYRKEDIVELYRLIDWLLQLPEDVDRQIWNEIKHYEEEQAMPYITTAERIGHQEGLEEGLQQGMQQGRAVGEQEGKRESVRLIVRARFGLLPETLEARIAAADGATLDQMIVRASQATSVDHI